MKLVLTLITLGVVFAQGAADVDMQRCLYCKKADLTSGMMTNYYYCADKTKNVCYENAMDYLDLPSICNTTLKMAW